MGSKGEGEKILPQKGAKSTQLVSFVTSAKFLSRSETRLGVS
jgi:hypothetical protein